MRSTPGGPTEEEATFATELTKDEYDELATERVFVLPVGILEEHGPHLPLGTDIFQAEAIVNEAAARTDSVVLPTLNYGNCHSTRNFPGSISIEFDTLRSLTHDILSELARHGVQSVVLCSGHAGGGHMRALKQAGRRILEAHPQMRIASLSEWEILFGYSGETHDGIKLPDTDGHAGTMETARILYQRPSLVQELPGEHVPDEAPFELTPTPEEALPEGYIGDPSQASSEMGRVLHEIAVEGLADLLEHMQPPR